MERRKNVWNKVKQRPGFEDAEQVFDGPTFTFEDTRFDYEERRFVTLGLLHGRMVVIAHTPRGGNIRIISMRKGNKREQQEYTQRLGKN